MSTTEGKTVDQQVIADFLEALGYSLYDVHRVVIEHQKITVAGAIRSKDGVIHAYEGAIPLFEDEISVAWKPYSVAV